MLVLVSKYKNFSITIQVSIVLIAHKEGSYQTKKRRS